MAIVVLDPGHGGTTDYPDSSSNNATSPSGVREKDLTLDIAKRIRWSLIAGTGKAKADELGKSVTVLMTRETDVNVRGSSRARVARANDAELYLSIHFNGWDSPKRGTECYIDRTYLTGQTYVDSSGKTLTREGPGLPSSGIKNINVDADAKFAAEIAAAAVHALSNFDPDCELRSAKYTAANGGEAYTPPRGVKMRGLATLADASLGTASNACRACLLEVEFITTQVVDDLFNGDTSEEVRNALAAAVAIALVKAL